MRSQAEPVGGNYEKLFLFYLRKEVNVLFNDTLNTFYLRLYDVGHIIKDYLGARGRKEGNV